MELTAVRAIIDMLAEGRHPLTGVPIPPDSPYNDPEVIRALFTASRALAETPPAPRAVRAAAPNAGKPWHPEDDEQVRAAHLQGLAARDIAGQLGRTRLAVEARLVRMGLIEPRAGLRYAPIHAAPPPPRVEQRLRPYAVRSCRAAGIP